MKGLTAKVREAARGYDGVFRAMDLVKGLDVQTYEDARQVRDVLRDLSRTGEVIRVDEGKWVYGMRPYRRTLADVMWHLVRSHRQFTTEEIERLSGAGKAWVREYLRGLRYAGYLRQKGRGNWELIKDVGPERPALRGQESGVRGQGSGIRGQTPDSRLQTPGSQGSGIRGQGSGIRGQTPDSRLQTPGSQGSGIRGQGSGIRGQTPDSRLQTPGSQGSGGRNQGSGIRGQIGG